MYQQITQDERYLIGRLLRVHRSICSIAKQLGRSPSTISREIRRNRREDGGYRAERAQEKTNVRRRNSRRGSQFDSETRAFVFARIKEEWAPDQIEMWLKENRANSVAAKTIYRWIKKDRKAGGDLYSHLRQAQKRRRKAYRSKDSRGKLAGKRPLKDRPFEAQMRLAYGHFEIDVVLGKVTKHCALTLVDRLTRFTLVRKLNNKTSEEVNRVLTPLVSEFGIKTLTADNGCEFHGYKKVEEATGALFYFARPHHSWERGTNENTNGLIRQYFPKGMSMRYISEEYFQFVESRLNNRPRRILGYASPWEVACQVA